MVNESNLLHLILKNIYKINGLLDIKSNELKACYFFKQSNITFEVKELYKKESKKIILLDLVGSIKNCENVVFIRAFKICFWKIAADNYMGYAMVENVSHNNIIIDNLCLKTKPQLITEFAYYFYNFVYNTFNSNKVFIL